MEPSPLIQFTQELVRIFGFSGAKAAVAHRVEAEMRRLNSDRVWTDANGIVIGLGEYVAYTGTTQRCEKFFPAWRVPEEDPFVTTVRRGLHAAGIRAVTRAYRFCTNAAYSAGIARVPPRREMDT